MVPDYMLEAEQRRDGHFAYASSGSHRNGTGGDIAARLQKMANWETYSNGIHPVPQKRFDAKNL